MRLHIRPCGAFTKLGEFPRPPSKSLRGMPEGFTRTGLPGFYFRDKMHVDLGRPRPVLTGQITGPGSKALRGVNGQAENLDRRSRHSYRGRACLHTRGRPYRVTDRRARPPRLAPPSAV